MALPTAVVARLTADRRQKNCPVRQTATAILILQDVAGILLLVVANALGGGAAVLPTVGLALLKAVLAFGVTIVLARVVVRPLFDLAARTDAEEVFTAAALFFALVAGWATGQVGLSLTLGAFLGRVALAETAYRHTVAAEIKPLKLSILTAAQVEDVEAVGHFARATHPDLRRIAAVKDDEEANRFNALGVETVVEASTLPDVDLAASVLRELNVDEERIAAWRNRTEARGAAPPERALEPAYPL